MDIRFSKKFIIYKLKISFLFDAVKFQLSTYQIFMHLFQFHFHYQYKIIFDQYKNSFDRQLF